MYDQLEECLKALEELGPKAAELDEEYHRLGRNYSDSSYASGPAKLEFYQCCDKREKFYQELSAIWRAPVLVEHERKRFLSYLTEEQRQQWEDHDYVEVVGSDRGVVRLHHNSRVITGNVEPIKGPDHKLFHQREWGDHKKPVRRVCLHTQSYSFYQTLISQLLLFQTDEESFWETALIYR